MATIGVKEKSSAIYLAETLLENEYSVNIDILKPERLVRNEVEYAVHFNERD